MKNHSNSSDSPDNLKEKIIGLGEFSAKKCYYPELISQLDKYRLEISERQKAEQERNKLVKDLQKKTQQMQELLHAVTHDLRSPLINIVGFAKELSTECEQLKHLMKTTPIDQKTHEKIASVIQHEIPESIDFVLKSTDKMNSLIEGLSTLARAGRVELNVEHLEMNQLLKKIIDTHAYQAKQLGATITLTPLQPCYGDEEQMNQVFSNLISNALKYLHPDRKGEITIFSKETENSVSIYGVQDNGMGIDDLNKEKVFKLFYRTLEKVNAAGEGVGLTITKEIIERHGGDIWVESKPGQGSCFYVSLPSVEPTT